MCIRDSDKAKTIYDDVNAKVNEKYLASMYQEGYSAYNKGNQTTAIEKLKKVVEMDESYQNGNAIYYLAQAYRRADDMEQAVIYYQKVLEQYPGTERARCLLYTSYYLSTNTTYNAGTIVNIVDSSSNVLYTETLLKKANYILFSSADMGTSGSCSVKTGKISGSDSGNTGGNTGGSDSGNTGGSTGGSDSGNTGGSTGGSDSGNTGGNTGGNDSGNTGGSTGESDSGNTGGSTGGNDSGKMCIRDRIALGH